MQVEKIKIGSRNKAAKNHSLLKVLLEDYCITSSTEEIQIWFKWIPNMFELQNSVEFCFIFCWESSSLDIYITQKKKKYSFTEA